MATNPITSGAIPAGLLPPEVTAPIFTKATETSAVMQLARRVPLALTASTSIPVPLDVPAADWDDQAGKKPLGSSGVGIKTMTGKKVAVLIPVSEEVARTNAAGLYDQLQQDLPTSLARAFDRAAIHGQSATGAAGPFADYLVKTTHSVDLGHNAQNKGGLYADLVEVMGDVVDGNYDFNGWVADQRLRPKLMGATDTTGQPIFNDARVLGVGAASGLPTLLGEPLAYSRGVSGKVIRQSSSTDTGLRAVGGDWSQAAYGVGMDISIRVSTEATYVDESDVVHSAFQENLVLLLAEAVYGFVIGDVNAFATLVDASVSS